MAELGGLLGDYGSDASSGDESEHAVLAEEPQRGLKVETDASETSTSLLNQLPAPKKASRPSVGFVLPFNRAALMAGDSSEEDEPTVQIQHKASSLGRSKIFDYLPMPKNTPIQSLGDAASQLDKTVQDDSQIEKCESPPADSHTLPNNEMYRVDEHGEVAASYQDHQLMNTNFSTEQFPTSGGNVLAYLDAAGDQGKSRKRDFDELEVTFKEINQEELRQGGAAADDSSSQIGIALGSEYASSLVQQSAPFKGSKLAKRKHQIGTLYHDMKMNELKMMANKSQGVKSKHETEAKYGWR